MSQNSLNSIWNIEQWSNTFHEKNVISFMQHLLVDFSKLLLHGYCDDDPLFTLLGVSLNLKPYTRPHETND